MGKTSSMTQAETRIEKHPHERGEDSSSRMRFMLCSETPPRAWGRPHQIPTKAAALGNTPTSVGKTRFGQTLFDAHKKHPHERGEDSIANERRDWTMETPPRAWGRPTITGARKGKLRNTPTSVGKTCVGVACLRLLWKHPHERGEDR